jgi:ABC-type Fe3+ transport system substrate-binding protein
LDNKVYNSHSALADALASGEIDVAWDLVASRPIGLKAKGAPVDWRPMEPLYAESNCVGILQSTKSPYTAALFTDFMLSKDAAEANDKWEQGRIYGNTTGQYTMSLGSYPSLKLFPVVDTATLKKWQLVGERLFIRRQ